MNFDDYLKILVVKWLEVPEGSYRPDRVLSGRLGKMADRELLAWWDAELAAAQYVLGWYQSNLSICLNFLIL
jgi:hypothetical protein